MLPPPMEGRGWLRLAQRLYAIMIVGLSAFQPAHAGEAPHAALAAAHDGPGVAMSSDDRPVQAKSAPGHVVDDFEAVDADAERDPDPDEEGGRAIAFVASRPKVPLGSADSTPTILGSRAREVSPTATLVAERPARGPPMC